MVHLTFDINRTIRYTCLTPTGNTDMPQADLFTFVPELEHHCGSWIVVNRGTNDAVIEIFTRSIAEKVNTVKYEVLTALQYLARLNR